MKHLGRVLIACLLLGGGIAALRFWPTEAPFSEKELRLLLKRKKPIKPNCDRSPLRGTAKPGSGSNLYREAVDPEGPHKTCFRFVDSVPSEKLDRLYALPPHGRLEELDGKGVSDNAELSSQVLARCAGLVRALEALVAHSEVCSPYALGHWRRPLKLDETGIINFIPLSTAMNVGGMMVRTMESEGESLAAAQLALDLLRARQDLGRGGVTWVEEMIASVVGPLFSQLTSIALSPELKLEDKEVLHGELLRFLEGIRSASDLAEREDEAMRIEASTAEDPALHFAFLAIQDSRLDICEPSMSYVACAERWDAVRDGELLPVEMPTIANAKAREEVLANIRAIAARGTYVRKASHFYASMLSLELALRSQLGRESCPAERREHALGAPLRVEKKQGGQIHVGLPAQLTIKGTPVEFLSFSCPQPDEP